ncbi:MAG: hypothetical protein HZA54_00395 [Planctomycetes bacterium]|nr:hypothetical protein [Planctomycetota bacterium]
MPSIAEGDLTFHFPEGWRVAKFDAWSFYRNQFQRVCGGSQAIDLLAIDAASCLWLIEVKDYRRHPRTKVIELPMEIAGKVRDTLAGLVAAKMYAQDAGERSMSVAALQCRRIRVILHLEQPAKPSKRFPRAIDPAAVEQRLKQLLKAVDAHPKVLDQHDPRGVAWQVA